MTTDEFNEHLTALRLGPGEAAQLLGVSERSLRRWAVGEAVPGPAEAALRAWRRLDAVYLPWKPDAVSALLDDQDQLRRIRDHSHLLDQVMKDVEARGGPRNPWTVDLFKHRATFGPMEVGFHLLQNDGFSPASYRRLDRQPSPDDTPDIQDAVYCIAQAFSWARAANEALLAVADYTRQHASIFVREGPAVLSPSERTRRQAMIAAQADRLQGLAVSALDGAASYAQFEQILGELHRLGFFPDIALISAVARSMVSHVVPTPSAEGR